jgi:TolB-like protein
MTEEMTRDTAPTRDDGTIRFGSFELNVALRELRNGASRTRLQDQPFEILSLMLDRAGRVVTREELCRRLWPEGTHVDFEHSLNAAVKRLRTALGDKADSPTYVETVPRRGYRLVVPSVADDQGRSTRPSRLRIAVLPFADFSGASAQECFTDGLMEEMVGQLTVLVRGQMSVIARSSLMTFKGSPLRLQQIGELLCADFLVEGSVRRDRDRVRIAVRLVHSASETNVWSDVYDLALTDTLAVQADVAIRISQSLHVELTTARQGLPGPGG